MEIGSSFAQSFTPANTATNDSVDSIVNSDFETFLKMMTVQMKNQDPLDPIKSEDFSVQLATFSGVEQQVLTNELLTSMMSQLTATGMTQYAGWVGMEARAPMPASFQGAPVEVFSKPVATADSVNLVVSDANGDEVRRMAIPPLSESVEWNGIRDDGSFAAGGEYSFTIESYSAGELLSVQTGEVYGRVVEARSGSGQTTLITSGGAEIAANLVTGLREPTS